MYVCIIYICMYIIYMWIYFRYVCILYIYMYVYYIYVYNYIYVHIIYTYAKNIMATIYVILQHLPHTSDHPLKCLESWTLACLYLNCLSHSRFGYYLAIVSTYYLLGQCTQQPSFFNHMRAIILLFG